MEQSLEHILASRLKDGIIEYLEANPDKFQELVQLATSNKPPHSARAAWLLARRIEVNDHRIQNDIPKIIQILMVVKDGQQRDLMHLLYKVDINEEQEGELFDICVELWCTLSKIPSVRYTAFKLILKIVKKHPALYEEVLLLTEEDYINPLSSGIKRSIQKMIKSFKEEHFKS